MKLYKKWWFWLILVVVAGAGFYLGLNETGGGNEIADNENTEDALASDLAETISQTQNEIENDPNKDDYYFDGKTLNINDATITITDIQLLEPGEGDNNSDKPIIAFWFDVENTTEDKTFTPMTPWIACMTAIQDNDPNVVNTLETGILPDEKFLESQLKEIKPGGTASHAHSYELDDTQTPVTLIATQGALGDEIGSVEINLDDL